VISCKQLFALFLILVLDINAKENIIDEYKVEILVFKFKNIETNENFINELNLPNRNVINLVDPKLFLNKDALTNFPKNNSFFSNLLRNINPVKNQQTSSNDEIKTIINPKNWYRESSKIDKLSKLYKNIQLNNQLIYLDSKSWIQSIDDENKSKYVFIENHDKEFGFFLKLYKKRFLHLDLKAYLGITGEQKIESTQDYIKNSESLINNSGEADQELEIDIYLPKKFESIEISNKADEKTQNKEATILNKFIDY